MRGKSFAAVAIAAVAALAAVGCGSSSSSGSGTTAANPYGGGGNTQTSSASGGGGGGRAVVSVANNPQIGQILVDSKGMTLYYFEKDKGGKSACYGACAQVWPAYTTSGNPTGQKGASASKLGTSKRTDGTTQVTYAGYPLYTYVSDTKPGDIKGNNLDQFGAEWYALHPNGKKAE
jgi:predicted lipoprotein with Yx(FWY)xxD motif